MQAKLLFSWLKRGEKPCQVHFFAVGMNVSDISLEKCLKMVIFRGSDLNISNHILITFQNKIDTASV
jgi:hypothetical protein